VKIDLVDECEKPSDELRDAEDGGFEGGRFIETRSEEE